MTTDDDKLTTLNQRKLLCHWLAPTYGTTKLMRDLPQLIVKIQYKEGGYANVDFRDSFYISQCRPANS